MGERMTDQMQIVTKGVAPLACDALAPPYAPLTMPKQVLQAKHSRRNGVIFAWFAQLKHGFRRAG